MAVFVVFDTADDIDVLQESVIFIGFGAMYRFGNHLHHLGFVTERPTQRLDGSLRNRAILANSLAGHRRVPYFDVGPLTVAIAVTLIVHVAGAVLATFGAVIAQRVGAVANQR